MVKKAASSNRDPVSPLLFNLVGDILTKMLIKGAEKGLIKGVAENFR